MHRPSTVERAYELAEHGPCNNVDEIRTQLKREFHESVDSHLSSPTLSKQLRSLCAQRRMAAEATPTEAHA